jgi:hypothetical protein
MLRVGPLKGDILETPVSELVKVNISHLVKFAEAFRGVEVHIHVGGKFLKLNYADENFLDILRKLQQRSLEVVYLSPQDTKRILEGIQASLSPKSFYDPKTVPEKRMETLDASMRVIKNIIQEIGIDEETVKTLKTINTRAVALISEAPTIFSFVQRFKKNCTDEFMKSIITNYITSMMIDSFLWKSEAVKEKTVMASFLCDVFLEPEDFKILADWERDGGILPDKIRNHPTRLAETLRKRRGLISMETITIVEQHHELPDGQGFPGKVDVSRFNQLSTVFIIAQRFVDELFDVEFNFSKRSDIIQRLQEKYFGKTFEKSIDALVKVVH